MDITSSEGRDLAQSVHEFLWEVARMGKPRPEATVQGVLDGLKVPRELSTETSVVLGIVHDSPLEQLTSAISRSVRRVAENDEARKALRARFTPDRLYRVGQVTWFLPPDVDSRLTKPNAPEGVLSPAEVAGLSPKWGSKARTVGSKYTYWVGTSGGSLRALAERLSRVVAEDLVDRADAAEVERARRAARSTTGGTTTTPLLLVASAEWEGAPRHLLLDGHTLVESVVGFAGAGADSAAFAASGDVAAVMQDGRLHSGWVNAELDTDATFASRFDDTSLRILAVRSRYRTAMEMVVSDAGGTYRTTREEGDEWTEAVALDGAGSLSSGVFLDDGFVGCRAAGGTFRGEAAASAPLSIWTHLRTVAGLDAVVLPGHEVIAAWGNNQSGERVGFFVTRRRAKGATWSSFGPLLTGVSRIDLARPDRSAPGDASIVRFTSKGPDGVDSEDGAPLDLLHDS